MTDHIEVAEANRWCLAQAGQEGDRGRQRGWWPRPRGRAGDAKSTGFQF